MITASISDRRDELPGEAGAFLWHQDQEGREFLPKSPRKFALYEWERAFFEDSVTDRRKESSICEFRSEMKEAL